MDTHFAIGCLVQWYETDIIEEYLQSVKDAIDHSKGKENVIIDIAIFTGQQLEKFNGSNFHEEIYTIADYRRDFNNNYCEYADVLIWGESDAIIPRQMFVVLDSLHQQVKTKTPKYLGFFGGCKMWDDSWKILEHPEFTDKPFIEGDTENWWSLRYTMDQEEMDNINNETEELDIKVLDYHKFNGCGLVISSEVIKAGANIPKGMFFVHEDTSFMHMTQKILGTIPQFVIKNILLVHNRKHPLKRHRVKGEENIDPTNTGLLRKQHTWYQKAFEYSSQNLQNLFNPNYQFKTWKDVFKT